MLTAAHACSIKYLLSQNQIKNMTIALFACTSQFPNVSWQNTATSEEESRRKERSNSISPSNLLADKMSGELLQQLDLSQLAPLPRTVDIFGKPTEDLVESYKTTLRESMARQHGTKLVVENNLDGLVQQRKESLAEKDLVKEDSIGLA